MTCDPDNIIILSPNLPYDRDSDWLIDRRHCESKWHGQLHEVRGRLDKALKQISDLKQLTWISEQPCEYKNNQLLSVARRWCMRLACAGTLTVVDGVIQRWSTHMYIHTYIITYM